DPGDAGDNNRGGAPDKEPAFDDADDIANTMLQQARVVDADEAAIEDVVAAVGDERMVLGGVAQYRRGTEPHQVGGGGLPAELRDLDRHRGVIAEPLNELFLIDDDDQAVAGRGDDLFAQQGATQPLDQIERAALDLVGAVDRQIDALVFGKAGERDAEPARQYRGPFGCGDPNDLQ